MNRYWSSSNHHRHRSFLVRSSSVNRTSVDYGRNVTRRIEESEVVRLRMNKVPVFGIRKRDGKVYTQVIKNAPNKSCCRSCGSWYTNNQPFIETSGKRMMVSHLLGINPNASIMSKTYSDQKGHTLTALKISGALQSDDPPSSTVSQEKLFCCTSKNMSFGTITRVLYSNNLQSLLNSNLV